jgi:hypothetical protein
VTKRWNDPQRAGGRFQVLTLGFTTKEVVSLSCRFVPLTFQRPYFGLGIVKISQVLSIRKASRTTLL